MPTLRRAINVLSIAQLLLATGARPGDPQPCRLRSPVPLRSRKPRALWHRSQAPRFGVIVGSFVDALDWTCTGVPPRAPLSPSKGLSQTEGRPRKDARTGHLVLQRGLAYSLA